MSLSTLERRINYLGGDNLGRLNKQKLKSFKKAMENDYNTRTIITQNNVKWQCIINNNYLQPDYDRKLISIELDAGLAAGDIVTVIPDNIHWMIYLINLTETAYLRAEIIRCRYQITLDNDDSYWIYFKGPSENSIDWNKDNDIVSNDLNLTGTIFVKQNAATKSFFTRFKKIKIDNKIWEVQATDTISVPGIIEVSVKEYFDNVAATLPSITKEDETIGIIGKAIVPTDTTIGYTVSDSIYDETVKWKITNNTNVKIKETLEDNKVCKVNVASAATGSFILHYGDYTKTVTINSSTSSIQGSTIVYPYDVEVYSIDDDENEFTFSINNTNATIVDTEDNQCTVEITSSKSGSFTLIATSDSLTYTLPVTIKSL